MNNIEGKMYLGEGKFNKNGYSMKVDVAPTMEFLIAREESGVDGESHLNLPERIHSLVEKNCVNKPYLKWYKAGNWTYSAYDLSGTCSCGKPYYEHPELVKENEEVKLSLLKNMRVESNETLTQKSTTLRKPRFFDKMMDIYNNMK